MLPSSWAERVPLFRFLQAKERENGIGRFHASVTFLPRSITKGIHEISLRFCLAEPTFLVALGHLPRPGLIPRGPATRAAWLPRWAALRVAGC
jgi:hypothetical protein